MRFGPRYLAPAAVAVALAAVTAFSPSALGAVGDPPKLPGISPLRLAMKVDALDQIRFSGTVSLTVDIGLPQLPKLGTSGGADPVRLLSGTHHLQVATDTTGGAQRQRVAVLDTLSEYDAVRDGTDLWLWDSTRQSARHGSVNALTSALLAFATPGELLKSFAGPASLETVLFDTAIKTKQTTRVAGRDCYVLDVKPHQDGTTLGDVTVAVDAATGMPLSVTAYPVGSTHAAIAATFTSLTYSAPADAFRFVPPPGATVVEEHAPLITTKPYRGTGKGWTSAVEVSNFDPDAIVTGLGNAPGDASDAEPSGTAGVLSALAGTPGTPLQSYLRMMLAAGTPSAVGSVYTSRLISAVFTPDHRLYLAFSTAEALVQTVTQDRADGHV